MARDFDNSTSNYLSFSGTPPVTAAPISVSLWYNPDGTGQNDSLFSIETFASNANRNEWVLTLVSTDVLRFRCSSSSGSTSIDTTATISAGVWHQMGFRCASATSRHAVMNGVLSAESTTSRIPATPDRMFLGLHADASTVTFPCNGKLAEVSIWNVALHADEWAALGSGVPAWRIRPTNLVAYWPLDGNDSPELDLHPRSADSGSYPLTMTGSVAKHTRHPPILARRWLRSPSGVFETAAASVEITPPRGDLTLSTTAPSVVQTTSEDEQPARVDLALSTTAPTVEIATHVNPDRVDLTLSTTAPTVDQTTTENELPARVDLALSMTAPTVGISDNLDFTPARVDLVLSMTAPSVVQTTSEDEQPARVDLALTGTAPTVDAGTSTHLFPAHVDLALSATAPSVVQTTSEDETPAHDDLVLSGTAPAVDQTTTENELPARVDLVLSTTAPSVSVVDPSAAVAGDSFNPMLVSPGRLMNP